MAPYLELWDFSSCVQSPRKSPQQINCKRNHSSVILFVEAFLFEGELVERISDVKFMKPICYSNKHG